MPQRIDTALMMLSRIIAARHPPRGRVCFLGGLHGEAVRQFTAHAGRVKIDFVADFDEADSSLRGLLSQPSKRRCRVRMPVGFQQGGSVHQAGGVCRYVVSCGCSRIHCIGNNMSNDASASNGPDRQTAQPVRTRELTGLTLFGIGKAKAFHGSLNLPFLIVYASVQKI